LAGNAETLGTQIATSNLVPAAVEQKPEALVSHVSREENITVRQFSSMNPYRHDDKDRLDFTSVESPIKQPVEVNRWYFRSVVSFYLNPFNFWGIKQYLKKEKLYFTDPKFYAQHCAQFSKILLAKSNTQIKELGFDYCPIGLCEFAFVDSYGRGRAHSEGGVRAIPQQQVIQRLR